MVACSVMVTAQLPQIGKSMRAAPCFQEFSRVPGCRRSCLSRPPHSFPHSQQRWTQRRTALHPSTTARADPHSTSTAQDGATVGVVIVDHGSRKAESNDMLVQFVQLYRDLTKREIVEVAHMELAEPTIEQAVRNCAQRGATKVVVAPYFLSRGRHIQQDIPALVAEAQRVLPGVQCVIAEPIGIDTLMAQLIENRVEAADNK